MVSAHRRLAEGPLIAASGVLASLALGALSTRSPMGATAAIACIFAVILLGLSPIRWAFAALLAAFFAPGIATLTLVPDALAQLHLAFAWGALLIGLIGLRGAMPRAARYILLGLAALFLAEVVSAAWGNTEPVRPIFSYLLLGEPFAVAAAVVLGNPTPRTVDRMVRAFLLILVAEVPLAVYQWVIAPEVVNYNVRSPDVVTGTFAGAAGGSHVLGGLAVIGVVMIIMRGLTPARVCAVIGLLVLPFLSDAKATIFALPIASLLVLFLLRSTSRQRIWAVGGLAVLTLSLVLAVPALNRGYFLPAIERTAQGQGGKPEAISAISEKWRADPARLVFGLGPAESVSHAAFLTADPARESGSPVALLRLKPATVAATFDYNAFYSGTIDSPRSSAIGLIGDLGVFGAFAYLALVASVLIPLRRARSGIGIAAAFGFVLMLILGPLAEWWEQGLFTVPVGFLVGLALSGVPTSRAAQ